MKFALPALTLAAALGLAACNNAEAPEAADTAEAPAASETTVITNEVPAATTPAAEAPAEGSSLTVDGADVDATVSEDGVQAEVNVDE